MRKNRLWIFLLLLLAGGGGSLCAQSMSDSQVLEYVKESVRQGKEQKQIAAELARQGVTKEQALRVKEQYERQNGTAASTMTGTDQNEARLREETKDGTSAMLDEQPTTQELAQEEQVFGRNIFNTRNLTFEPNSNLPTPPNYRLGPGDEVVIDIWGASQNTIRQTISPDGTINLQELGPAYLSGMTVEEAGRFLKAELGKVYSNENNQIRVTLGNTRTIQINIMGEVVQPGTYALSAFSTVFHALYRAGGVNRIGSLRDVQLVRNGKRIASVDVYDFILEGRVQSDISLQEGDVVIVPAYESLVKMSGKVKRAMKFEMRKDETLATLLDYAGGFEADAYTKTVRIVRQNGEEYEVRTVEEKDYPVTELRDGDVVTVGAILNRFTNKVEIKGAVYRPDIYELDGKVNTVRALIGQAQGLMDDAFTNRAVLQRQRDDMTSEVLAVDVKALMEGRIPDIPLHKNDILYIPSIHDVQEDRTVSITGEVAREDTFAYGENMTLEDIILQAGGLKEAASTVRVDVSRRIKDSKALNDTDTIAQTFSFALKDGFVVDGEPGFVLQPFDEVHVRRSPGYQEQQNIEIEGEIMFAGTYTLSTKTQRVSDVIARAGGVTNNAYVKGARLERRMTEDERRRMQSALRTLQMQRGNESLSEEDLNLGDTYFVGMNLEEALAHPGSEEDIVLREGDKIIIPQYTNTVKINGAVMHPTTISYLDNKKLKSYVDRAGGYAYRANKKRAYVIYMNGTIDRLKSRSRKAVQPGCEIIIPYKQARGNFGVAEIVSLSSASASSPAK